MKTKYARFLSTRPRSTPPHPRPAVEYTQSGATSFVLYRVLNLAFPDDLKAVDEGTRVELSDFMHVIDAVQLHIAGAQNATGSANPNPVGPPSSQPVDNPAAAAPRH